MSAQIRGAAASIPANIAEGYGRGSAKAYCQFLRTARGSLKELETHILLAERVDLIPVQLAKELISSAESIGKMLNALIKSINEGSKQSNALVPKL